MKLKEIQEGKVKLYIPVGRIYDAPVFYNPEAELSRDISICALQVFQKDSKLKLNICDALAATGIKGLRYAKEVSGVKEVVLNDKNPKSVKLIKKNVKKNKLSRKCKATKEDANVLLRKDVYNVIDIDPFGSPNVFMDSAARSIFHKGFLIVSATDQAPLCGTYPKTCLRKYGIESIKTDFYNELGIRILISFIMLTLSRYGRAFIPLLIQSTKHYYRIFGKIEHAGKIKSILDKFGYLVYCSCGNREYGKLKEKCFCGKNFKICGQIYLGKIIDKKFCKKVLKEIEKREFKFKKEEEKMLKLLINEADMPPFYFDLHKICKKLKKEIPKMEVFMKKLKNKGYKVSRTHFCPTAIKTNISFKKLKTMF